MPITKEFIKKSVLPCIPLRGSVAFPGVTMNLEVGRALSKRACDAAVSGNGDVLLIAQKDASVENPDENGVYGVGTKAKIKQLIKNDGGNYRIIVEPECRAVVDTFYKKGKYFEAEVTEKTVIFEDSGVRAEALARDICETVSGFMAMLPKLSKDLIYYIKSIKDLSSLCDFSSANIVVKPEDKQKLLEEFDPVRRAELLILTLEAEKELLETETEIHKKVHERLDKNQREYYLREEMKAIREELGEGAEFDDDESEEYLKKINEKKLSPEVSEKLLKELKKLGKTPYGSAEGAVIRNYLDTVLEIPFEEKTKTRLDIGYAKKVLDADHDGLNDVKDRVIEYIAALKLNPGLKNQIICLVGPPGTGKTSVASSIARAMNRKFVRISLGGVRDEADIRGHRKTYIGSMPGRIINALVQAKVSNPLILMDEIDKLTSDSHGDPSSALLEVLDSEQNKSFRDHFVEVPVDLSDCLFITTANTLETVPQPLIDRMEIIEMKLYTRGEKFSIAKNHLIPKQEKRHGLNGRTLKFDDSAIYSLIDFYTREAGVRNLERFIAKCCRRAAKQIACGDCKTVKVSKDNIKEFAGEKTILQETVLPSDEIGTVCGMAYTEVGGEIMKIEALAVPGTGKTELTGSLGDVMKEASEAAISYVRSRTEEYGIDPDFYKTKDIHIHFPEGAVPKDGPSAGVATAVAVISELSGITVKRDVAMTGEITLRGRVLAIGGLREKTMAAYLAGVKTIILPAENKNDECDIVREVLDNVNIVYVSTADEAVRLALASDKAGENARDGGYLVKNMSKPSSLPVTV